MLRLTALLLLALLAAPASATRALIGEATVVDGNNLAMGGTPFRLRGLDAPGLDEPGGAEAAEHLRALVDGLWVTCVPDGSRFHGRIVAACFVYGRDLDLAAELVGKGLARYCPGYRGGRYPTYGTEASRARPERDYCVEGE